MAQAAKKDKAIVTCNCCSGEAFKFGSFKNKNRVVQRYRCNRCVHSALKIKATETEKAIQRTPAEAAGLTDHCWTVEELILATK